MKSLFSVLTFVMLSSSAFAANIGYESITMNGPKADLQACGSNAGQAYVPSKVNAFRGPQGQVVLRFNSVKNCSRLSILAANGMYTELSTIRLIDNGDGTRSGDFDVSSELIAPGVNQIVFRLASTNNRNPRYDEISLIFNEKPATDVDTSCHSNCGSSY